MLDHSRTALLVDDEASSSEAHVQRLRDDGYTVILARDALEGLNKAKQSLPAVIFTHIVSAGQSNVSFIQALRSDDSCRHISVIVLSGSPPAPKGVKPLRSVHRDNW
jgi:CheY-like chemotaxis protein